VRRVFWRPWRLLAALGLGFGSANEFQLRFLGMWVAAGAYVVARMLPESLASETCLRHIGQL